MEMLDRNEIEQAQLSCLSFCPSLQHIPCYTALFHCGAALVHQCYPLHCGKPFWCDGVLWSNLTDDLKACGEGFYIKCPGFDRIERYCEFEPAIDAAKWKEKMDLDKVAKLEARIQELELKVKTKG
jgi:hypothetical protein